jgi:hypothetical protein
MAVVLRWMRSGDAGGSSYVGVGLGGLRCRLMGCKALVITGKRRRVGKAKVNS